MVRVTNPGRRPLLPVPTRQQPVWIHHRRPDALWESVTPDDAVETKFEHSLLVRTIPMRRGQRHTPGDYWSATDHDLLPYESWLEARWLTLFDYDADVVAMSTQPFRIDALADSGPWSHVPDIFLRLDDGRCRVVDVRTPDRMADPDNLLQSRRTASVCDAIGFEYQVCGEPDPTRWANVEWLSGYRRPSTYPQWVLAELRSLVDDEVPIGRLMKQVQEPLIARPALFHLCWHHEFGIDLSRPFQDTTEVWRWPT